MVLMNKAVEGYTIFADAHVLAASHVSHAAGSRIAEYAKSAPRPTASITFRGTVMGSSSASSMAFFSRPQEETEKQEIRLLPGIPRPRSSCSPEDSKVTVGFLATLVLAMTEAASAHFSPRAATTDGSRIRLIDLEESPPSCFTERDARILQRRERVHRRRHPCPPVLHLRSVV
uniref:Uncharacterized protein n=1 Tax=Zea mays TaxID=4577 RepID=A0A804QU48_MAIZE